MINKQRAAQFFTDTPTRYEQKQRAKTAAYEAKKAKQINVTPENHEYVWNHLSQTLFAIDYASFHITALQRKSVFPDKDAMVEFARNTEVKFNSFVACLTDEKKIEYRNARTELKSSRGSYPRSPIRNGNGSIRWQIRLKRKNMKLQIKGEHKITGEIVNTVLEVFSAEYHEFIQQYRITNQKIKL